DVIRLRDRATAFAAAAQSRGRRNFGVGVVVVADQKKFRASLGEVQHVLGQASAPATVLGGIAHDTKGADLLSGEWGGNLDRSMPPALSPRPARIQAGHRAARNPQWPVTPPRSPPIQPSAQPCPPRPSTARPSTVRRIWPRSPSRHPPAPTMRRAPRSAGSAA